MRNLKKFLALVLAMMMTLSLMVTVNAATSSADLNLSDSNAVSPAFLEDIQVLTGMEVIKGYPDGSFKPATEINRHQMATFIYRMTTGDTGNLKDRYLSEIAAEKFPDVKADDDYAGYIGYCWVNGFIAGFPDGTFRPMSKVTGYQALVMILRGMGYNNPNDNFTGNDWQSLAMSRARMNNLLVKIDKSVYSGTFSRPAPRELVAEMVFQGLIQPQVTWTTAMGYQKYGMEGGVLSNILNPTLGYENFGLTNHKGIIVGNSQTGEPNLADGTKNGAPTTKIGFSMDVSFDKGLNIGDTGTGTSDWTIQGDLAKAEINDDIEKAAYYYTSALHHNTTGTRVDEYNVTLAFQWESGLKQFNHAVDVWYDCRGAANETVNVTGDNVSGSVTFKTNLKTYAVFDRVQATKVVAANITAAETDDAGLVAALTDTGISTKDGVFFNYAFARNEASNWGNNATAATTFAASPIKANNDNAALQSYTGFTTDWPLYLVISNSADKTADVVISLDMTLSKVVQDNNTQNPLSTSIWTQNGVGTDYFDQATPDKHTPANSSPDYSEIADANRVDSNNIVLGDYVATVAVTGTNGANNGTVTTAVATAGNTTDGNATARAPLTSTFFYEMTKLTSTVTANLVKFDKDSQQVTLSNGKVYERSIFALATDGSFMPTAQVMAPTSAGEYTFYLDEEGNWLFWEQGRTSAEFIYATYIDYTTDVLSSGFNYPMLYVNAKGEDQQRTNVNAITAVTTVGSVAPGTVGPMNDAMYMNLMLPKRTNVGGNSTGFVPGQYVGYIMSSSSTGTTMTAVTGTANNTGFVQAQDAANSFGDANTTINANSVAIGAHPAGDSGNLFLTERTKFVVVDGAGTANQKATTYNGLKEFLGDSREVTIDVTTEPINPSGSYLSTGTNDANGTAYAGNTDPWQMVYYSTEEDPYAQNYDQMDKHVDTVFIPAPLVKRTAPPVTGNLFFVGSNKYGLIDAPNNATQYTFYQNGQESVLWIDGLIDGNDNDDADTITNLGNNVFYQLRETSRTAVDGGKIYALVPIENLKTADAALIGKYYGSADNAGTAASTTVAAKTTEMADGTVTDDEYLATTRNSQVAYMGDHDDGTARTADDLYNVSSANVLNLNVNFTINSLGDLNEQSSLTSNQGVAVSCVLGSSAKMVDFIYVNYAAAP